MKNQIGKNNQINKKKYKKSLPYTFNPDAGNVKYNIDTFNKMANVGNAPTSASGMNGMAESYDRENIIARIKEFGKHYNFDKYTDAQLYAMLNRLVDASNHKKSMLPRRKDKIDLDTKQHIMNDDPSYNFDDPDREGEYRVESLKEALNRLDHYCIDNDKQFHDLRSLYENIQHQLTPQEKQELKKLVDTTNDPDAVKAYLDSKDPDKKNEELEEAVIPEEMNATEIVDWMYQNFPDWEFIDEKERRDGKIELKFSKKPGAKTSRFTVLQELDIYKIHYYSMGNSLVIIADEAPEYSFDDLTSLDDIEYTDVDFDESLNLKESKDNLTYDELIKLADKYYKQGGAEIIEFWDENSLKEYEKEFGPMTKRQAIRLMKVMGNVTKDEEEAGKYFSKQTFDEELNRKELETFSRAIFNAGDKEEAQKIIDEIYQYDKQLSLQLKHMWDDSASDAYNADKLSGYLLRYNESLDEGVFDTLKAKRQARLDKIDAKKRSQDPIYDKMRSWQEKEAHKNDPIENFVYDRKFLESIPKYEKIQVPKNVVSAIIKKSAETIVTQSFKDCVNLKTISIEPGIIEIGKQAFMNCKSLVNVVLPESVHFIDDEAFKDCSNLEKLTIPNTKVRLGKNVFEGCTKLVKNKNEELVQEDTVKQGKKWVNKGESGKTHGKFNTKKAADAQRKAMFANGYKAESLKESEEYTRLISEKAGPALQKLLNTDEPDMTYDDIKQAVEEFRIDLEKFPKNDLDIKYDCDKDRFYKKYRAFADICKRKKKELHPTGYGKMDFVEVKKKELCNLVDNRFPYGWKVYDGAADRQAVTEDVKTKKSPILYVIKDKAGNQLSTPSEDDSELWDRVASMEQRGRRGLKVVVYVPEDLNEDYTRANDEWGNPYTCEQIHDQLKELTNNFTDKSGTVRCWYEQEKIYGNEVLKKHYKNVEVSDGRTESGEDMSWIISYSDPIKKKSNEEQR